MQRVSIAMATYNGERYLREQFDSILAQTIPFYELIICDDASTDGTWDILLEYANMDCRIKVFRNLQNIGVTKNFERAIKKCSGEFIAFSDQDDIWLPDHLEILLNGIGDKMVVVGDAEIMDAKGHRSGLKLSYCEGIDYVPENDLQKAYTIFFYRGYCQGASMVIHRSLLEKVIPMPTSIHNYHDFWLSSLACFYGGISHLDTVITLYRRHEATVTGNRKKRTWLTKMRTVGSHVLFNRTLQHRLALVTAIRERLGDSLTQEQQVFLDIAGRYHKRRKTLFGRIVNLFFELKHFKLIYGCK